MSNKSIHQANQVIGHNIIFRNVDVQDAAFIVSLRQAKGKYISATSPQVSDQISWIERYKNSRDQAYFIICDKQKTPLGTVRLYDAQGDSFCWGSWILHDDAPNTFAIESALIVYSYALETLGFKQSHFDVRKNNNKVWQFHERFGARLMGQTNEDFLYEISHDDILKSLQRYKKFLPLPIEVSGIII